MKRRLNDIPEIIIPNLFDFVRGKEEWFNPLEPRWYLYKKVREYKDEDKFSNEFIELVYTTLISWGMDARRAKLSDFKKFKDSILKKENRECIQCLQKYTLEGLNDVDVIKDKIEHLFRYLELVADGNPKLVTYSKTLHFFVPNLLMPIDRQYTLKFFHTSFPKKIKGKHVDSMHIDKYYEIFEEFRQYAQSRDLEKLYADKFFLNKGTPKIIDNIIMSYIWKQ
jgi:hypothetical protein